MTGKLMVALHRPAPALLGAEFRARAAALDVVRLQVNLDDEAVAAAPLRFGPSQRIQAVLSAWTDAPAEPLLALLRDLDPSLRAWFVEERLPLPDHPTADGERADALANLAFLRRPAELDHATWLRTWLVEHTPVAIATQATFGYVQNVVTECLTPRTDAEHPVAGIVEELFPMAAMTDSHAFYGSGGDDADLADRMDRLMASVARFGADRDLDLVPTSRYRFALD